MINKKVYINYVFSCSEVFLLFSVYFIGIKILGIKVVIIRYFVFYTSDYDSTKLDIKYMKPYLGFLQHGSSKLPFPMISLASQKPIRFSEKIFLCEIFCINVWFKRFLYLFFSVFSSSLCMYQP